MSGHNPHSRVSQPVNSSSWNHLQVPYARQPQLAHMSSDRALRSSPLIWPNTTTNPADAFYNYMALTAAAAVANSNPKNTALDINPLLPFVRTSANAMPFNSVDLSLSSTSTNANRNNLTPSPRNQVSPGPGTFSSRFSKNHTTDGIEDSTNNVANKMDNNKINNDPIAFLNEMSEQLASMRSNQRNLTSSTTHSRDSNNVTSDLSNFRNNGGNDKPKQRNEPMELVKEQPNAANLFENESLSQSVHLQQLLGLAPPVTSSITPNLNDLSKSLLSIFNNTSSTSPMLISPKSSANFLPRQSNDTTKPTLNTSNDDSLDSQSCNGDDGTGKTQNARYRRRKPQKTVRLSNESNTTDSIATAIETDKSNAMKSEQHKTDANNSNGLNFPTFHSDANSILAPTNLGVQPPQTQSMDLSHHCATGQDTFENGLVNYSKSNSMDVTSSSTTTDRSDKNPLQLHTDEMSSLNLFGAVNFGHLRGSSNLTNDIATFPNTDDLVKKVEELVKCNEQNGFVNNDFGPMELIKSNANKLVSDAYENNRVSNGCSDAMKVSNNVEHVNNPSTLKHNGNGISNEMISNLNETNEDKPPELDHSVSNDVKMPTATELPVSNSHQNGEIIASSCETNADKVFNSHNKISDTNSHAIGAEFAGMSSVDMMYEKMSNEVNNQPNLNANFTTNQQNFTANTPNNENPTSFNSNELTKEALSASSSETPSNPSTTSKKKTTTKKRANNRCNGKTNKSATGKSNQKNAKSKDKSEKKSDINEKKKTKSADESTSEALNKFRGPYVHVGKDGTLEVINAPLNEEVAEKQSKFKKNYISQRPADRNKVRGLHVSTLSTKYDAVTTDISWMCVFCKLGPHKYGLGDLFGPFILSTESEDFQLAQIDPKNDVFKSHRNKTNLVYSHNLAAAAASKSMTKSGNTGNVAVKKKRKLNQAENETTSNLNTSTESTEQNNEIDIFHGMTQANDSSYEVWAHEDCIVWASGVHIIGARVVGLETAVWGSVRHQCSVCEQYGAMLSCLHRSCTNEVHVPCAKRCDWNLDEQSFQSRCSEHSCNSQQQTEENKN